MTDMGYCTVEDVRRVLQDAQLPGDLAANNARVVQDAITGWSDQLESWTHKHWYDSGGSIEDPEGVLATTPLERNDEHDLQTSAAEVDQMGEEPRYYNENSDALLEDAPRRHYYERRDVDKRGRLRIAFGEFQPGAHPDNTTPAYTRIRLNRKDVTDVTSLMVVNEEGGFDDWFADKTGGIGNSNRGSDWWVRINNRGVAELYLDVQAMSEEIASLASGVYVEFKYGDDELPMSVRRGVAHLAASQLIVDDEFQAGMPDQGQLVNVETKSQKWERQGYRLLEKHFVGEVPSVQG